MKLYTRCLLIAALVTGGLALLKACRNRHAKSDAQFLISRNLPLEQIALIRLSSKTGTLTLCQLDQGWGLKEQPNVRVELKKLQMFLGDLYRARITRRLPNEPLDKLGLTSESGAVTVELCNAQGSILESVTLGRVIYVQNTKAGNVAIPQPVGRYVLYHHQPAMIPESLIWADDPLR